MLSYADQLARVRAHVQGLMPLPSDLGEWVICQLSELAPADLVRLRRDQHLRRAGALAGGSCNHQAKKILEEASTLERVWYYYRGMSPTLGTFRGEVHAARLLDELPQPRRLRTILSRPVRWQSER